MALAVLALEHTMALEEQERLAHWRMTPTVL